MFAALRKQLPAPARSPPAGHETHAAAGRPGRHGAAPRPHPVTQNATPAWQVRPRDRPRRPLQQPGPPQYLRGRPRHHRHHTPRVHPQAPLVATPARLLRDRPPPQRPKLLRRRPFHRCLVPPLQPPPASQVRRRRTPGSLPRLYHQWSQRRRLRWRRCPTQVRQVAPAWGVRRRQLPRPESLRCPSAPSRKWLSPRRPQNQPVPRQGRCRSRQARRHNGLTTLSRRNPSR